MPIADGSEALLRHASATAARAVTLAAEAPAGPVHVNFPFREPLLDSSTPLLAVPTTRPAHGRGTGATAQRPTDRVIAAARRTVPRPGAASSSAGPTSSGLPADAVADLARAAGLSVLADPLSGPARRPASPGATSSRRTRRCCASRSSCRSGRQPEGVLRLGAMPTSKPLNQYMEGLHDALHGRRRGAGGWRDAGRRPRSSCLRDPGASARASWPRWRTGHRRWHRPWGRPDAEARAPPPDEDWLELW